MGTDVDLRSLQREASRRAVLDAAQRLAAADGFAALSMRAVAAAVGVRAPSLYSYFPSKDAIYDGLFRLGYEALVAVQEAEREQLRAADRGEALASMLRSYLAFCQADWTRYQLMFTRAIPGWRPSDEAYASSRRSLELTAAALAAHGVDDPDDVDLFTAIASGLAAQQFANDPGGDRWVRLVPTTAAMFDRHVAARGA